MCDQGSQAAEQCVPLNILLVEDNEADVKITLRAFHNARRRNQVMVVSDGQACVDYLKRAGPYADQEKFPRPDLILLDINMPKLDGFGVLQVLKSEVDLKAIPVVILSASKNDDDVSRSYNLGANSFIQKPVEYEEFVKVVDGLTHYWQVLNRLPSRKN